MSEPLAAHRLSVFALAFVLLAGFGGASQGWAQAPPPPPSESGQQPSQGQTQEAPPATTPTPATPTIPPVTPEQLLRQYPLQSPIGPPISPASPPGTTMPPWTPPTPPAPSQTNIPAPLLGPGGPGGAPGFVGMPGLTIPGAFAPTVTTVRGATLEFHPTLHLSEEYSDNFFLTSSRSRDNLRSIFGPGFTVLLNGARTFGALATTVDLVHDTVENSGPEVKVFPSVNAAIRYALTPRLALTFTDVFVRSDSANNLDRSGLRQGRQTSSTNSAALTMDWLIDQIATQAYYRNVLFFNEGDNEGGAGQTNQGAQNDSITHILGVNAATRVATDYLIRAGYEFSRTDTTGGSSNNVGGDTTSHTFFAAASRQFGLYTTGGVSSSYSFQTESDTRIWNASVFGAYGLPSGLSLSAAVGYSALTSDTQDSEGTVSANVNISYRFARAVISVGAFQDFRQTAQQGENFGTVVTRSYFGSFLYQLTPFINAVLRATYTENEPTGTGNVEGSGTQKFLTYGAAVNWQALRWLTASLQYNYTRQTGRSAFVNQDGSGNYAENRVTLSLFATF
jgi:hypothetical protein